MTVSVFDHKKHIVSPKYFLVDDVLESIRKCGLQSKIDKIRNQRDPTIRYDLKGELPCICFSGKFPERKDKSLTQHSGLCVLDIDHIGDEVAVKQRKSEISKLPYVYACFISPSGDGLKVVARIPANKENHRGHYTALMMLFPQRDSSSINESRVCYASADAEIYINKNATEFTDYVEPILIHATEKPFKQAHYTNYSLLGVATKMIRDAEDGQKHSVLLKASRLMGGYIAGGHVIEEDGVGVLEREISSRDISDFTQAKKTIRDGIAFGKQQPIEDTIKEIQQTEVVPSNGAVKNIDTVWENMKHSFVNGKARGTTTHFPVFDNNFTWKLGDVTLIIGRPNAGKSEFAYQLMLMKSKFDGWKWAVFTPENHPEDEFFDTMIHAYIGKTTDPHFTDQQMSMKEYEDGYKFVKNHFFYIYPENPTINEIESNFIYLIEKEGVNGTLIDPFNHLNVDLNERDDKMLKNVLTQRKRFASKYNTCDVITAHPKNMTKINGNYDVPDIYDIAGGAMWSNKVDNIMAVHRPNYVTDPKDTAVEIHVKKIKKQKLVGIPGMCAFDFSRKTNRYYQSGLNPLEPYTIQVKTKPVVNTDATVESEKNYDDLPESKPPF